jgi:NADH-quinone oxidoreductase subunit J
VTFLFVLMLAQSGGRAVYDRISWEPLLSSATGAVLVGVLTMALVGSSLQNAPVKPTEQLSQNILADDHVAHLGAELFSRYLIPVEVAGTLLLVALVGAIAMVSHQREAGREDSLSRMPTASAPSAKEPRHG